MFLSVFSSCVSEDHIAVGTGKRNEIYDIYSRFPSQFDALIKEKEIVAVQAPIPELTSTHFDGERYFADFLEDINFGITDGEIRLLYFPFENQDIAAYIITPLDLAPEESAGTLFFFHGYLNYSANYHAFFNSLLESRYTILAVDLPGHGLSTGPRGEIDDFASYGYLVEESRRIAALQDLPLPWFGAGHSTGGAALLIDLLTSYEKSGKAPFSAYVLASPLGRTRLFYPSLLGAKAAEPFSYGVKAAWEGEYSLNYVPFSWVDELEKWQSSHEKFPSLFYVPVLLAWGKRDDTLDLKYSRNLYERVFPNGENILYLKSGHNLYFDKNNKKDLFFRAIQFFNLHSTE